MRQRAVAVVIRHHEVLLVRDNGKHRFSLPGGGINHGETTEAAAARELYEELGMEATSVTRLRSCDFKGAVSNHKVCFVEAIGHPHRRTHEIDKHIWWNMKSDLPIHAHVKYILTKMNYLK